MDGMSVRPWTHTHTHTRPSCGSFVFLRLSVRHEIRPQDRDASATRRYTVKVSNGRSLKRLTFSVISTESDSVGRLGAQGTSLQFCICEKVL